MRGWAVGDQIKVTFQKTGEPFWINPHVIAALNGQISVEEFRIRSERDKPEAFQPFEIDCRILAIPPDSFCVFTEKSVCLSNGNGITIPSKAYCLRKDGRVAYFYNGNLEEWCRNVPTWSADWSDQIRPVTLQLFLAARFDKNSQISVLPIDLVRLIAKLVFETRRDPAWFFRESQKDRQKRRKINHE